MPVPDRPVSGETIAAEWGQGVHDRVFASKAALCTGGAISINDASDQTLPIDTATDDPGGWVDTTNNRLVVPSGAAGIYLIVAEIKAINGAADSETRAAIYVNGTQVASAIEQNEAGVAISWSVTSITDLVAADVIIVTARLRHDSGANPSVNIQKLNVIFLTDERGA